MSTHVLTPGSSKPSSGVHPLPGLTDSSSASLASAARHARPRVVLDTNICLDLFLFHDSACAALAAALEAGQVEAVTRSDCRDEWHRVLHYSCVPIHPPQRPLMRERYDAQISLLGDEAFDLEGSARLPLCRDPDDQMFLQLAQATGARWLLSKDKQLLKLNRKTVKLGLFAILRPRDWSAALLDR